MTSPDFPEKNFSKARFDISYLTVEVEKILNGSVCDVSCQVLEGDASDRTYFRVSFKSEIDINNLQSLIVMQLKYPVLDTETDFTITLEFLKRLNLPVPELFYYDVRMGLLFLEDCGTRTLEDQLSEFPEQKVRLYYQAVELLFDMQTRATKMIDPKCPAYHHKFDVEKLMWEFNFMLDHYVGGFCGLPLEGFARKEAIQAFGSICELISIQKLFFTHRDYHSRNLMVHGKHLVLLDFQDARMGPCQYDLVSLLKDSYIKIDDVLIEELTDLYIKLKEKEEGVEVDRDDFSQVFDVVSIQRNLKAIGTFAYQISEKKNHRYREYIAPTFGYIRNTLNRRYRNSALREVLFKYIPGLDGDEAVK